MTAFDRGFKTWCENTAISLRRELKLRQVDPLDPAQLAGHLDIEVWPADAVPGVGQATLKVLLHDDASSWSAITVHAGQGSVIVTNPAHTGGRLASDLMHELAHIVLGHDAARIDVSEDGHLILHTFDRKQEDEADWLSGCLLLPRAALLHARKKRWPKRQIADHYRVSQDMVMFRLNVSGVDRQLARRK